VIAHVYSFRLLLAQECERLKTLSKQIAGLAQLRESRLDLADRAVHPVLPRLARLAALAIVRSPLQFTGATREDGLRLAADAGKPARGCGLQHFTHVFRPPRPLAP